MYCLEAIKLINKNAVKKARRGHRRSQNDHSSYTGTIESGIILHSGAHRECRFLERGEAKRFVTAVLKLRTLASRDQLIESYF